MFTPRLLWLIQILAWDGVLPIVVALGTFFLLFAGNWQQDVQFVVAFFAPMLFAFVRSHLAWKQIASACHGSVPIARQFVVAGAIVLLLCFEWTANALAMTIRDPNRSLEVWMIAVGFYAAYLLAITWSLRPAPEPDAAV